MYDSQSIWSIKGRSILQGVFCSREATFVKARKQCFTVLLPFCNLEADQEGGVKIGIGGGGGAYSVGIKKKLVTNSIFSKTWDPMFSKDQHNYFDKGRRFIES